MTSLPIIESLVFVHAGADVFIYLSHFFVRGPDVPEVYLFAIIPSSNGLRLKINVNLQEYSWG